VWRLSHDNEVVGEWADEYVQTIANQVSGDVLDLIYEFLPEPIVEKLDGPDTGSKT
jgi:hypothetical protein